MTFVNDDERKAKINGLRLVLLHAYNTLRIHIHTIKYQCQ
jgi:hypothetical protein